MSAGSPGASRSFSRNVPPTTLGSAGFGRPEALDVEQAIGRTRDFLLQRQHPDGHWVAELEGDTILESEYILLLAFLGQGHTARAREAAAYLLKQQSADGSWGNYPGGPIDVSAAVKAYLALKITGHDPSSPELCRARAAILAAGGVERVNSFTRFYLAMLGLIPYSLCPAVPPELILIPDWAPLNIYEMSAWSRTIVVPLSLLWACQPVTALSPEIGIDELYASPERCLPQKIRGVNLEGRSGWWDWAGFFQGVDSLVKWAERQGLKPLRSRAIREAEKWILDRLRESDGLGAIFPPIVWTIIGLRCLGHRDDSPLVQSQVAELEKLVIRDDGAGSGGVPTVRLQPCLSPVWDTAITLIALRDAGVPRTDPAIERAKAWLLSKEVRQPGDWSRRRPAVEPGGWYFEYRNEFYPDFDDTAMVLIAFGRCLPEGLGESWSIDWPSATSRRASSAAETAMLTGRAADSAAAVQGLDEAQQLLGPARRGINWLKAMQSRDGGWGAFDADNTREIFTKVPFADHNAMIDPSSADITARILEAFASVGVSPNEPWIEKALNYVWNDQLPDGAWFGRWGVNYLYGTWQVLQGLTRFGVSPQDPRLQRGAAWIVSKQQPCGGWGETPATYDDPSLRGTGAPTASQTAWAILGLLAAEQAGTEAVSRGIQYLLDAQQADGSWVEPEFTGTGFPRVFYLRYHYYRIYFPLMALARYRAAIAGDNAGA